MAVATEHCGGFECNFVGEVSDFDCPICLHVTRDPNLTSCCGQHFCGRCISGIITKRKRCPFCKETRFTVLLDKKQKRKVLELKVKCMKCSQGCTWTGQLSDLDAHESNDCEFVDVGCPNDCGKELERRHLEEHLVESCPKRRFECEYCGYEDEYYLIILEHTLSCPKYPVSCPNNCTPDRFERATLKEHTEQACPLQQVDCEYQSFGCTTHILRKDMAKHLEENVQCHMLLTIKELKSTKEKLSDVEQKFAEAEGTIASLTEKVSVLEESTLTVPFTFYVHEFSRLRNVRESIGEYTLLTSMCDYRLKLRCFAMNKALLFALTKQDTVMINQWPIKCTVILTLLNQANRDQVHMTSRYKVRVESKATRGGIFSIKLAAVERAVSNNRLLLKIDIDKIVYLTTDT